MAYRIPGSGRERTWLSDRSMLASVQSAGGHSVRALMAPAWAGKTPGPQLALLWVFCRIDYLLATPGVTALARREHVYLEQRFSGHAPLTIDRLRLQALTCRRAIGPGDGGRQGW